MDQNNNLSKHCGLNYFFFQLKTNTNNNYNNDNEYLRVLDPK